MKSKAVILFSICLLSWAIMLLMLKEFGSYFGSKEALIIHSSELHFAKSGRGYMAGQVFISAETKFFCFVCKIRVSITAEKTGFAREDFFDPLFKQKFEYFRRENYDVGKTISIISNPLFRAFGMIEKPSLTRTLTTFTFFVFLFAVVYTALGKTYKLGFFLLSMPVSGLLLSCV